MKRTKSQDSNQSKAKLTKKTRVSSPSNGIDKSQQLLRSTQTSSARAKRASDRMDKRKGLGLVCGKPMPPLSELEKMYEGSDEDMPETTAVATLEDIKPPEENSTLVSNGTITPTTAKKYADEILKILSGQDAPQPIIPMKKYKKPEVPYIVGCTERERIPENPNCNVFKGDDYGITSKTNAFNEDEDEYCGDTPGFYINGYSLSKSIFNAHANEIASKLLSNENNPIIGSSDSEDTMIYELHFPKCRFSPVPSTSKDCETISINDQKFIESFVKKNHSETDHAIETFGKTMVIEDDQLNIGADLKNPSDREKINLNFEKSPPANTVHELMTNYGSYDDDMNDMDVKTKSCINVKKESNRNNKLDMVVNKHIILDDDDMCEIIDTNTTNANIKCSKEAQSETNTNDSPIVLQKYYNPFDPDIIAEIDLTNVDDVISENQSILDKYSKRKILGSVNLVENVENIYRKNTPKNVSNMQFGSKNNQTNTDHTINDQLNLSNELEKVVKEFFDKRGNTSRPHNQAAIFLHGHEKIFPEYFINNGLNNPIQRNFPEHSLNNSLNNPTQRNVPEHSLNNPIQRNLPERTQNKNTNKRSKRQNKSQSKDNNINPTTTNLTTTTISDNNVETPSQPLVGTCPICLDDFTRERVGSTNCGHLFCMPCLSTALKTKPKRCPTCRKKLTGLGYHQIFV